MGGNDRSTYPTRKKGSIVTIEQDCHHVKWENPRTGKCEHPEHDYAEGISIVIGRDEQGQYMEYHREGMIWKWYGGAYIDGYTSDREITDINIGVWDYQTGQPEIDFTPSGLQEKVDSFFEEDADE